MNPRNPCSISPRPIARLRLPIPVGLLVACMVVWAGCTDGIDPGPCRSVDCLPLAYVFDMSRSTYTDADTSYHIDRAYASFRAADENGLNDQATVLAGEVTLNGIPLVRELLQFGANTEVRYVFDNTDGTVQHDLLAAPGAQNIWNVSGSSAVGAFTVAIPSLAASPVLLEPSQDTLSVGDSLRLRWVPLADADRARTDGSISIVLSAHFSDVFSLETDDDGEAAISADTLRAHKIIPGQVSITLTRTASIQGIAPDGRRYRVSLGESSLNAIVTRN